MPPPPPSRRLVVVAVGCGQPSDGVIQRILAMCDICKDGKCGECWRCKYEELRKAVAEMREAQKSFFSGKSRYTLIQAKKLEQRVDRLVGEHSQGRLF